MMILLSLLLLPLDTCLRAALQTVATPAGSVVELLHSVLEQDRWEMQAMQAKFAADDRRCNGSLAEERQAIATAALAAKGLNASIQQAATRAAQLAGEIAGHRADVADWKAQQADASGVRAAEGADYTALRSDYSKTIEALERAIRMVKAQELAGAPARLEQLEALPLIPREVKQAWRHHTPGSKTELGSSGTITLLEGLAEKFRGELADAKKQEADAQQAHAELMRDLSSRVEEGEKAAKAKAVLKAQALADKAEVEGALAEATAAQKHRKKHLNNLTAVCAERAAAFEARRKLRAGEVMAVEEAVDIVEGPEAADTALRGIHKPPAASRPSALATTPGSLVAVERLLEARSRELHSQALSYTASAVKQYDDAAAEHDLEPRGGGRAWYDFLTIELSEEPEEPDVPDYQRELFFRPVSVTAYCIMWLTLVELLPHAALGVARNQCELCGMTEDPWYVNTLEVLTRATSMTGVMSLLFFGSRQLVLAITEGKGEPWPEVKIAQIAACAGLTLHVIILLFLGIAGNERVIKPPLRKGRKVLPKIAAVIDASRPVVILQYFSVVCVLAGIAGVVVSLFALMIKSGFGSSSTSLQSTVMLFVAYYGVQVGIWVTTQAGSAVDVKSTWGDAHTLVERVPMLMVLLLTQRMRFLQYYPPDGTPPLFYRACMRLVTMTVFIELGVNFVRHWLPRKTATGDKPEGSDSDEDGGHRLGDWQHSVRHLVSAVNWVSTWSLAIAFFMHSGHASTPEMSPTVYAIVILCFLFFSVHCIAWIIRALEDLLRHRLPLIEETVIKAKGTVSMCPQISVLFLAARLRALQITQNTGAPQWWEQDFLGLIVGAVALQAVCCLILPAFTGIPPMIGPDGNVLYEFEPLIGAYVVAAMKYTAFLGIYAGYFGVSWSLITITPETATAGRVTDMECLKSAIRSAVWFISFIVFGLFLSSAKVLGLAVKFALEALDDKVLGIQIVLDQVTFDVRHAFIDVHGLVAANPEGDGFHTEHLLVARLIRLKVNVLKLLKSRGKAFEITELTLEGVHLNYEVAMVGSNIQRILHHLDKKKEDKEKRKEEKAKRKEDNERRKKAPVSSPTSSPKSTPRRSETKEVEATESSTGMMSYFPCLRACGGTASAQQKKSPGTQIDVARLCIKDVSATVSIQKVSAVAQVALTDVDIMNLSLSGGDKSKTVAFVVSFVAKTILKSAVSSANIMEVLLKHRAVKALGNVAPNLCCICLPKPGGEARPKRPPSRPPSRASGSDEDPGNETV